MNGFNFTDYNYCKRIFTDYFDVDISRFYEKIISVVAQKILIDLFLFDDWLHNKHGSYEEKGLSMKQVVIDNYGADAYNFLNKFTL